MSMRWWRSRRKGIAGLGLFALMLQLVLSFGHIHARDLGMPRVLAAVAVGAQTAINKSTQAPAKEQVPSRLPDDECPICMTAHMAASGLLPTPPSIPAPAEFAKFLNPTFIEQFSLGVTRHVLFQTRAPPIA
jgi:hypothetical protein